MNIVMRFYPLLSLLHVYQIYGLKLDEISFTGKGSVSNLDPTYVYEVSSYFQDDICFSKDSTDCWVPQGVSVYGEYITHSFYQAGTCGRSCSGGSNKDGSKQKYSALSIQRMDDATYTAVLIDVGEECHNGDHVMTKIDDVYYFIISCEQGKDRKNYLAIFSEDDINYDSVGIRQSDKTFKHIVNTDNIIKIEQPSGIRWDYISRYNEINTCNTYIVGDYSKSKDCSTAKRLNLKRIKIDPDNNWDITILTEYEVKSKKACKVQGATMVQGHDGTKYMMLSTNSIIRRCDITPTSDTNIEIIGPCYKQCKLPSCKDKDSTALQGGETDGAGSYFVGTEWSGCVDYAFYKIRNIIELTDQDQSCLNYPDDKLNAPQSAQSEINDKIIKNEPIYNELISHSNHNRYIISSPWIIVVFGVVVIILLFNAYCIYKQNRNMSKKVSYYNQSEVDEINIVK